MWQLICSGPVPSPQKNQSVSLALARTCDVCESRYESLGYFLVGYIDITIFNATACKVMNVKSLHKCKLIESVKQVARC